jgi:hypothetical protein
VERQNDRVNETCDVAIIGGGLGGCAAALAATALGLRVVLTEPTKWLGGQLTSQAVPPDEHPWIETTGCTARYREFRGRVREWYRLHRKLSPHASKDPTLNPGMGWVSRLCFEPSVAVEILNDMLAGAKAAGRLKVWLECEPLSAERRGDRIASVCLLDRKTGHTRCLSADWFLEATEMGDLLPLVGVEYRVGAEGREQWQEPHALDVSDPQCVQAITWCAALGWDPEGTHRVPKPEQYDYWKRFAPEFWGGPILSWDTKHPVTGQTRTFGLRQWEDTHGHGLFEYRRVLCADTFAEPIEEATIVNWPQNDYFEASILDVPPETVAERLERARQLTLSLIHWLQTEAPRPDGGVGYPQLRLRPDIAGTTDGLAMAPYVRESRRLVGLYTLREQDVSAECHPGCSVAPSFEDSVGVGFYRIDLHPRTNGRGPLDIPALPFEIPLRALIPRTCVNLIAAGKALSVTHIANGCTRLHPVEWNVGEAAGLLAGFCALHRVLPADVAQIADLRRDFQNLLEWQEIQYRWSLEAKRGRKVPQ